MTNVDILSSPEWPSILQSLELSKPLNEIATEDVLGKVMESLEHCEAFYKTYAKWMGFGIRIDDVKRRGELITMKRWVCSKEGFRRDQFLNMENRKKRPKPFTRTGCQAAFWVLRTKGGDTWMVKEFVPSHNHDMVSVSELQMVRSNRQCNDGTIAQVVSMNKVGIKTSQIVAHMALQAGGYNKFPCQLRDVYNKVADHRRKDKLESDSEGALAYLDYLSTKDPNFYVAYQVDDENRLANLFWADGNSRRDFMAFGDVLAFDTTYQTNKYNKPLLILVGVNHHFDSCIFGFALLLDETIDTFSWLMRVFLDCMNNKKPPVVLTDGDPAMKVAISDYLPQTKHRLCGWHLGNNVPKHVKKDGFKEDLCRLMYNYYTEDEFEEKWWALLEQYGELDNPWLLQQLYDKRYSWAETFLRGIFIAGQRITQRCESMHSALKKFLLASYTLREFVQEIDIVLTKHRHTEFQCDYTSRHTSPQLPPYSDVLRPYYKQAAEIYTRDMYYKVAEQISKENAYSIVDRENQGECKIFSLTKFQHGEIRFRVSYS